MAKYIELNPYKGIVDALDDFVLNKWDAIKALCLREHPSKMGLIRESNFTKEILNAQGMIVGYINCHVLNHKFSVHNLKTRLDSPRYAGESPGQIVNTEFFKDELLNPADDFELRLTIKQYQTKAIGLSDVTFSSVYRFNGTAEEVTTAIRQKVTTSLLWKDPGYVIATKKFFDEVESVITGWAPAPEDVTIQTLMQVN